MKLQIQLVTYFQTGILFKEIQNLELPYVKVKEKRILSDLGFKSDRDIVLKRES